MIKCKHCNKSDFGVNMIIITKDPVRFLNGKPDKVLGESEVIEEVEYCYCNICKKQITKDDLYEYIKCPVCNREVDKIVNGKCTTCDEVSKEMETISKEDLIIMLMRQQMQLNSITNQNKVDEKVEKKKKEVQKAKDKVIAKKEVPSDISTVKSDDADDILAQIENLDTVGLGFEDEVELDDVNPNDEIYNEYEEEGDIY